MNHLIFSKDIKTFENKDTVDQKQTYGPLFTNSYRLQTIDRMLNNRYYYSHKINQKATPSTTDTLSV